MLIDTECIGCIVNQSRKVADAINADEVLYKKLVGDVEQMSLSFDRDSTPPEIAADVYAHMSVLANKEDLYSELKSLSTQKAQSFLPFLYDKLKTSEDRLLTALKIAVAGNVIDLAAAVEFDLQEELEKVFESRFSDNNVAYLQNLLESAHNIVILGDNTGEHIFDYLLIETLQELYPSLRCSYFVRGVPIINDVTLKEAKEAGFDTLCELVDSGVNTPGFSYERATPYAQKLFDEADVVISKGMGNYESLTPSHRRDICFLLKVKCNVVATSLGRDVGDIICKVI